MHLAYLFEFFIICVLVFFFKQRTAYEMRCSDWSSDVCSSDLLPPTAPVTKLDGETLIVAPLPAASARAVPPAALPPSPRSPTVPNPPSPPLAVELILMSVGPTAKPVARSWAVPPLPLPPLPPSIPFPPVPPVPVARMDGGIVALRPEAKLIVAVPPVPSPP